MLGQFQPSSSDNIYLYLVFNFQCIFLMSMQNESLKTPEIDNVIKKIFRDFKNN